MNDVNRWGKVHRANKAERKAKKARRGRPGSAGFATPAPEAPNLLAPLDLSDDLVTVSVPTWRTPPQLLERAVVSVVRGNHKNVRVVVISDGEDRPSWEGLPPALRQDPRVVCLRSPKNMGPYFLHDVVLRAAPGPLFAVQDSDDVSLPHRFSDQLKALHGQRAECVHGPIREIRDGTPRLLRASARATDVFSHPADHFGLYSVGALMRLGGYHCGYRVGYDTLVTSLLNLLAVVRLTARPGYVRHKRPGSLTSARATGHGSDLRSRHRQSLRTMWAAVFARAQVSRGEAVKYLAEHSSARCHKYGDNKLRAELVAQVRERLAGAKCQVPPINQHLLERALNGAVQTPYSISRALGAGVYYHCAKEKPQVVLDVGSGLSTVALAIYAARFGGRVLSLEHDRKWLEVTKKALASMGLLGHVELLHAPLAGTPHGPWYSANLRSRLKEQKIDFVFLDGPPEANGGRAAAVPALGPHLADGAMVWVHDALRDGERRAIGSWKGATHLATDTSLDPRGVAHVRIGA